MRVLEEDHALAAAVQHQVGDLRIAAQRAAVVAVHPGPVLGPATAPGHFVEPLARGSRAHAPAKARQQLEVARREIQHGGLERIVGDQRQRLLRIVMEALRARIPGKAGMDALHLDPVARRGHGGQEGLAVDHALALERHGLGEDGGRIDRVGQINGAVNRALVAFHAHHLGHQLHQPAFAAIGIAAQAPVGRQHAGGLDGVEGTAHGMQAQLQLADAGLAGAQPAEQCGILGLVVDSVGGQAQAYRHTGSLINSGERSASPCRPANQRQE